MSVLDRIVESTRADVEQRRREVPVAELEQALERRGEDRPFSEALIRPGLSLIAEYKRRSPSAGLLREGDGVRDVVSAYERAGAAALSVLTEHHHFAGTLEDLREARAASTLPILRKDFVVDPYQVLESRAAGADLVLLIVAALDDETLRRLHDLAGELGLTVLVEVHDEAEATRAVDLGAELVGVNARNLKTLEVDPDTFGRLAPLLSDRVLVAESGITSPVEVKRYVAEGARAVLVGEALVRDGDPEGAVRAMTGITA
jgi:indole-3-glycerol phosphate synthase